MPNMSTFAMILGRAGRALLQGGRGPRQLVNTRDANTDPDAMDARSRQVLWLRQLYAGLMGFVGGGGAALYYVFRTWDTGPHRVWIALLAIFTIAQAFAVWFARGFFVTPRQRENLFIAGVLICYVVIATTSALDGGIESPISLIWVLPSVFLLMGFSKAAIVTCGSIAVGLYLIVAWITPGGTGSAAFAVQLVVLVNAVFMVLLGAIAREERERVLTAVRNQLSVLATIDSLTGCINQQAFSHIAATEMARAVRYQHVISMLALDVDNFKSVNDEHGHIVGDEVLRQLGMALRASVRATDIVARMGGDELLVLCPETDLKAAIELAERLQATAKELKIPFKVTLSVGICSLRPKIADPQQLREYADRALYEAKRQGRDRYAVFTPADGRPAAQAQV